eukprot:Nk52_evm20s356 gene=Nk52_evmTU20s356
MFNSTSVAGRRNTTLAVLGSIAVIYNLATMGGKKKDPVPEMTESASSKARALDQSKALPVYKFEELDENERHSMVARAVKELPTGMEKEEEEEHHIQAAISAQQVYGAISQHTVIPTPDAQLCMAHFEKLYKKDYVQPKQYSRIQDRFSELTPPGYDMDEEDLKWLEEHIRTSSSTDNTIRTRHSNPLDAEIIRFETILDRFEKGSMGKVLVTESEAKRSCMQYDDAVFNAYFDYWRNKRAKNDNEPLIPSFKLENKGNPQASASDPYVAFRRRTERMQTRKNRKNDEASFERMLKLQRDLNRVKNVLTCVGKREKLKKKYIELAFDIIKLRNGAQDFKTPLQLLPPPPPILPPIVIKRPAVPVAKPLEQTESPKLKKLKKKKQTTLLPSLPKTELDTKSLKKQKKAKLPLVSKVSETPSGTDARDAQFPFILTDLDELMKYLQGEKDLFGVGESESILAELKQQKETLSAVDTFKPQKYLRYHAPLPESRVFIPNSKRAQFRPLTVHATSKDGPVPFIGRRRFGRGGRIVYDRAQVRMRQPSPRKPSLVADKTVSKFGETCVGAALPLPSNEMPISKMPHPPKASEHRTFVSKNPNIADFCTFDILENFTLPADASANKPAQP